MGELWRDLVDLLRARPLLWVPVLLADLLGYLLNLGRTGLLQALVWHQTAQHSALGGAVLHAPLSPAAMQNATILALLLSWLTYLFRILLYSGALVATAALVGAYVERAQQPLREVRPALGRYWGGILDLTLRSLAIYAVAALLFSWLSTALAKHDHLAILRNPWFGFGLGLLMLLVLVLLLTPVALRVLSGRTPDRNSSGAAQQFAAILAAVTSLLAAFVAGNNHLMTHISPVARYPLEIIGSLIVALPYVLLFTGLALLARRVTRDQPEMEAA